MRKTIFFSVGEPSGDQHAARLIRQIQYGPPTVGMACIDDQQPPSDSALESEHFSNQIVCRGFGGPEMRAAGCKLDLDLTGHAVVGLVEVLPKLREFFRFADQAEQVFASGQVDAVVLVDFPGFNWHIAKRARRYGIPVYYYCPPQLWAWGGWRVNKLKRSVDHVLAVLPIEETYFSSHGVPVTYVGHPFFDAVAEQRLDEAVMRQLRGESDSEQDLDDRLVAVLPGSRDHEVKRNFPVFLETIRRLEQERHQDNVGNVSQNSPTVGMSQGNVRYAVAAYRDRHCLWCREQLTPSDANLPIDFFVGQTSEIIESAHCAMMVSGSVSLELMARGTPAAVIYRVGRLLHAVGKRVLRVDSVTLPNLMAGRKIFPEFVSVGDLEPAIDFLQETTRAMLEDAFYYRRLKTDLESLRQQYGVPGASQRAAQFLRSRLGMPGFTKVPEESGGLTNPHELANPGIRTDSGQTNQRRAA